MEQILKEVLLVIFVAAVLFAIAVVGGVILFLRAYDTESGPPEPTACEFINQARCGEPPWTHAGLGEGISGWHGGLYLRLDRVEYTQEIDGMPPPRAGYLYVVLSIELRNTEWVGEPSRSNPPGTPVNQGAPAQFRADQFSVQARSGGQLTMVDSPLATALPAVGAVTDPVRGALYFLAPADEVAVTVRFIIQGTDGGYVWGLPGPAAGIPVLSAPTPRPRSTPRPMPTARPVQTPTQVPAVTAAVGTPVTLDDLAVAVVSFEYADAVAGLDPPPPGTVWLVLDLELRTLGTFMVPHRTTWLTAADDAGRGLGIAVPTEGGLEDGGVRATTAGEPATLAGAIAVAVPIGTDQVTVRYLAFAGAWGAASWTFFGPSFATPMIAATPSDPASTPRPD